MPSFISSIFYFLLLDFILPVVLFFFGGTVEIVVVVVMSDMSVRIPKGGQSRSIPFCNRLK